MRSLYKISKKARGAGKKKAREIRLCTTKKQDKTRQDKAAPQNHGPAFVRACAVGTHVNVSQETSEEPLYTEIYKKNAAAQIEPRTQTHTLCAVEICRNALQHFIRANYCTEYGNLQEKCRAQSKCTSTFHKRHLKSHCIRKFTRKMPRPRLSPERRHTLCASLRSRTALQQHFIRATVCGNLQEKCRGPGWARGHTHTHFVRACAVDMHVNMSQDPLYTEIYRKNAGAQIEPRTQTRTLCELAQSKCSRQSKRMSRFHKSHFIRPKTTAQTLCEPAQSERMSRFHKSHFIRACAVETRVKIPQEPLYAKIYR